MTEPAAFCLGCGCNLAAEQVVELGELRADPRGDISWSGGALPLTAGEHLLLGSLAQARGRVVSKAVLQERIGYEGDNNVIEVFLVRIRRKLRSAGAPTDLIETVMSRGIRLNLEAVQCQ
jgi:DNA-binding response OmpR family regulator